ncbi:MAG: hypothetical protein ACPGTQ_07025 [Colwellia sp.]
MFKKIAVIFALYVGIFTTAISGQSNTMVTDASGSDSENNV